MATGSKIELFRIAMYVFFPVGVFYYFNLPDFYDNIVLKKKKEIFPPDEETYKPPTNIEDIKAAHEKIRADMMRKRDAEVVNNRSESAG